jgi:hypothetical protein
VKSLVMELHLDLVFFTEGQLAIDICAGAYLTASASISAAGRGVRQLHRGVGFLEGRGQGTYCGFHRIARSRWPRRSR